MKHSRIGRNIWLGIENLLLHKLRSLLTMLGVVFGVGSVVAMLAVGEGASKEALEQIRKLGSNNIIINGIKPVENEPANQTRTTFLSVYGLTYDDHQRIAETYMTVKNTAAVKVLRKNVSLGERSMELRLVGTDPSWFQLVNREVLAGRVITADDIRRQTPVAVMTEFGARKLLATESVLGQNVKVGGSYFEVIGIIKSETGQAGNIQVPDQQVDIYIPLNVARQYFGDMNIRRTSGASVRERVELHQIIVQVDRTENVESTAAAIENMLKRFHDKVDYAVSVPLALLNQAKATKRTFNIVLGSIACISLLVGGIGIMNIMLASVTERTREIGIRRAIGAKKSQVIAQFLIETVVLSTMGGIIGLGMGVLIPVIITFFAGMPTVITGQSVFVPLVISVAIGIVFGLYPAVRAAGVDPIVALRHE